MQRICQRTNRYLPFFFSQHKSTQQQISLDILHTLPLEVWYIIFQKLNLTDIRSLALTAKIFSQLIRAEFEGTCRFATYPLLCEQAIDSKIDNLLSINSKLSLLTVTKRDFDLARERRYKMNVVILPIIITLFILMTMMMATLARSSVCSQQRPSKEDIFAGFCITSMMMLVCLASKLVSDKLHGNRLDSQKNKLNENKLFLEKQLSLLKKLELQQSSMAVEENNTLNITLP